ncbi:hypothetical protein U1Q18_015623 [Sarracenia purpurea var. burkii]
MLVCYGIVSDGLVFSSLDLMCNELLVGAGFVWYSPRFYHSEWREWCGELMLVLVTPLVWWLMGLLLCSGCDAAGMGFLGNLAWGVLACLQLLCVGFAADANLEVWLGLLACQVSGHCSQSSLAEVLCIGIASKTAVKGLIWIAIKSAVKMLMRIAIKNAVKVLLGNFKL